MEWNVILLCYSNPERLYFAFVFSLLLNLLNTYYFNKYLYNNRLSNLAIQEKTNRVEDILSWKNPGIVNVLILSLEMPDKTKLQPWKFCKIVLQTLGNFNAILLRDFWNTGLVSSGDILTSWGEGTSSALVGHPFSNGITKKMPYGEDVASHCIFSYWVG